MAKVTEGLRDWSKSCKMSVLWIFQVSGKGVPRGVSRVFQRCFKGVSVSRVFQRCFAGVSSVFQGYFKGLLSLL